MLSITYPVRQRIFFVAGVWTLGTYHATGQSAGRVQLPLYPIRGDRAGAGRSNDDPHEPDSEKTARMGKPDSIGQEFQDTRIP
jgi:hypothetical protein